MTAYRHGAVLIVGFFVAAGVVSAVLLTGRPVVASDPELAVAAVPAGPASAHGVLQRSRDVRLGRFEHVGRGLDDPPEGTAGAVVVDAARVGPTFFFQHAKADEPTELVG
jgi:hypothetical protein